MYSGGKKKKDGAINAAGSYGDKLWGRFIMEVNDPHELNWGGKTKLEIATIQQSLNTTVW